MADHWQEQILMVIPSINGAQLLRRMLPTLRFKPANVVVLDQGSTDDTAAVCAAAGVVLVQLGHPHTYTQASNIGATMARERGAKYVCISNNDIAFRTDVLAELHADVEDNARLWDSCELVKPLRVMHRFRVCGMRCCGQPLSCTSGRLNKPSRRWRLSSSIRRFSASAWLIANAKAVPMPTI